MVEEAVMGRWARWLATEPVRTRLYAVGLAVLGLSVGYGLLAETLAPLWVGLLAAMLGIPAVESARDRVTPWPGGEQDG